MGIEYDKINPIYLFFCYKSLLKEFLCKIKSQTYGAFTY